MSGSPENRAPRSFLSDAAQSRDIRRRELIVAGAWAVPPVLLVSASPGAAASPLPTVRAAAVANNYLPKVRAMTWGEKDTLFLDSAQVWYDSNVWNLSPFPGTASFFWRVVVYDSVGNLVATLVESHAVTLEQWKNETAANLQVGGLKPGDYKVASEITSVTYSPNPTGGHQFVTLDNSESTSITLG